MQIDRSESSLIKSYDALPDALHHLMNQREFIDDGDEQERLFVHRETDEMKTMYCIAKPTMLMLNPDAKMREGRWYEYVGFEDEPMVVFAQARYNQLANPGFNADDAIWVLTKYLRRAAVALFQENHLRKPLELARDVEILVDGGDLDAETEVSYQIRVPAMIVENMRAQRTFWKYTWGLVAIDKALGESRARLMEVKDASGKTVPFLNFSIYQKASPALLPVDALSKLVMRPLAEKGLWVRKHWGQ